MALVGYDTGDFAVPGRYLFYLGADHDLGPGGTRPAHQGIGDHRGVKETVVRAPSGAQGTFQVEVGDHLMDPLMVGPVLGPIARGDGQVDGLLDVHLVIPVRSDRQGTRLLEPG